MMNNSAFTETYLKDYRPSDYLIESVHIEFNLDANDTLVRSALSIISNPNLSSIGTDLFLDGKNLELVEIKLDGKTLDKSRYSTTDSHLCIKGVAEHFVLETTTRIHPSKNTELQGLYISNGIFCTQCEAEGFRHISYFIDRPDIMACYTVSIVAEKAKYPVLLSNGNMLEAKDLDQGRHQVIWNDPFKKPSYLFALVAGDLDCLEDNFVTKSGRNVVLRIFVEKGKADKTVHAMQALKKAMDWDEKVYGREYDLDLYMIVAVNDFTAGAMENKGLNIFNDKFILADPATASDSDYLSIESVIAHEYFHNWTGNRITCRDWFQLSLKEGLTIFRDQCYSEDTTSKTLTRIEEVSSLRNSQFPEDNGPLAHPVRPESYLEISNFYTTTIYSKGAELLRMIRTILGECIFHKGMDLYFERFDGQAVTIEDFTSVMEEASGVDLTQFKLWYSQAGTPVVEVVENYDPDLGIYELEFRQSCPPTPTQPIKKPMHIPVSLGLLLPSGEEGLSEVVNLHEAVEKYSYTFKQKPIPSLLREFSAPIKIKHDYSDEELLFLFRYDSDEFNAWEAGQKYAINLIIKLINNCTNKQSLILPTEYTAAIQEVITRKSKDKIYTAELLTLPSSKYISNHMTNFDVDTIFIVREFVRTEIAKNIKDILLKTYEDNHDSNEIYNFNMLEIGKRRLKNACMSYLMLLSDDKIIDIALRQFQQSLPRNMSDTLPMLVCFANADIPQRDHVLQSFYDQWKGHTLVMDKWLSAQAASKLPDALERVKRLMHDPCFDINNPNKVYALIGSFCQSNFIRFHALDGEGYRFTADQIVRLDTINSQVAAILAKTLSFWRSYDARRQQLMRNELERIMSHKISANVYEVVSKSLA